MFFVPQIQQNQVHHSLCQPLDLTEVLYTALLSHQRTQSLSGSQHPAFIKVRLSSLTEIFLEIFIFLGWSKPLLRTDLPSPQWQSWLQAKTKPGLFLVILGLVFSRPLNILPANSKIPLIRRVTAECKLAKPLKAGLFAANAFPPLLSKQGKIGTVT